MKKIMFLFAIFSWLIHAGDTSEIEPMQDMITPDKNNGLLTFFRPYVLVDGEKTELDDGKALVLVLPGFNIKPDSMDFMMDLFASRGIPSILLNFDGCKVGDTKEQMTFEKWLKNATDGIEIAINTAQAFNRKLLIVGHSNGATYAQYALSQMSMKNALPVDVKIGLVLLAPADGLKSLRQILNMPNLPENNRDLLEQVKNDFWLRLGLFVVPLGQMICGGHAAQQFLTFESLEALINPGVELREGKGVPYPQNIKALRVFHEDDGLMDYFIYYETDYKNYTNLNLGTYENSVLAHTFEYLKGDPEVANLLLDQIFDHFKSL